MTREERDVHLERSAEAARVNRLSRHEMEIRRVERERAARRLLPCLPYATETPCDFDGCVS